MRFHNAKLGQELFEAFPIIALALAALVQVFPKVFDGMVVKQGQTG